MIGRIGGSVVRQALRSNKRHAEQHPTTGLRLTLAVFCVPLFSLSAFAWFKAGNGALCTLAAAGAVMFTLILLGKLSTAQHGTQADRRVVDKYASMPDGDPFADPEEMRHRIALLDDVAAVNAAVAAKYAQPETEPYDWRDDPELSATWQIDLDAERERRVEALLSVVCPVPECAAGKTVSCALRPLGHPFAVVQKEPLVYCHVERLQQAVATGAADREDVIAQLDGITVEGING